MTRDDIRKKLIYNQNQIGNIRTTINEQESQIENLEGLRNSFNRLLNDFNYKHNMQNARISDVNNMSYINSKIVSSYTSAMHGVVNGSEYRKACNEIYRAIDKVNSQIRKLQNQISNNYSSIKRFSCNIAFRYVENTVFPFQPVLHIKKLLHFSTKKIRHLHRSITFLCFR